MCLVRYYMAQGLKQHTTGITKATDLINGKVLQEQQALL